MTTTAKKEPARFPRFPDTPHWYCVKTTYKADGSIDAEIVADEKTKIAIVLLEDKKPLDGVYEDRKGNTAYYTYHEGYEEAQRQVEMTAGHRDPVALIIDTEQLAAAMMAARA